MNAMKNRVQLIGHVGMIEIKTLKVENASKFNYRYKRQLQNDKGKKRKKQSGTK
jgi:hypothetical protein